METTKPTTLRLPAHVRAVALRIALKASADLGKRVLETEVMRNALIEWAQSQPQPRKEPSK